MTGSTIDRNRAEELFHEHDCPDFKWIDPKKVVVAQWVRMKCETGCPEYGRCAVCPPHVPAVTECERFFSEYSEAVLFRFEKSLDNPEDRHAWTRTINKSLLKLERAVFLAGHFKAYVLFIDPCNFCKECAATRIECKLPMDARPSMEGLAVDVFSTVRQCGFPINVLKDHEEKMNRYGLLMLE